MIRKKKIAEIIKEYYEGDKISDSTGRIFAEWFKDESEEGSKLEILYDILNEQAGDLREITPEKVSEIMAKISANESRSGANVKVKLSLRKTAVRIVTIAASLVLVAGAGWFFFNQEKPVDTRIFTADIVVENCKIDNHTFADGSLVYVNSGSKLIVNHNEKLRVAELEGESFFNVSKDADRPFVVKTADLTVKVLGTQFNIEAYPGEENIIVTLIEGKISLTTRSNDEYILEPNEQLIYNRVTQEVRIEQVGDVDLTLAWRSGQMVCQMKMLNDIFKAFERKYGIEVIVDDVQLLSEQRITARFGGEDPPETVMKALGLIGNFTYEEIDGKYKIISANAK